MLVIFLYFPEETIEASANQGYASASTSHPVNRHPREMTALKLMYTVSKLRDL